MCLSPLKHSAEEIFFLQKAEILQISSLTLLLEGKDEKRGIKNKPPPQHKPFFLGGRSKPKHLVAINMPRPFAVLIPVQMQSVVILITSCGAPFFWKPQRQLKCDPSPGASETKGECPAP